MSSTSFNAGAMLRRVPLLIGLAALMGATGCIHVSQRAWDNGRAMSSTWQYRDVLAGNRNPKAMRSVYYNATPLAFMQQSVPFPAFGHWY